MGASQADKLSSPEFDPAADLKRLQRLDREALERLHDAYYPRIYRYAMYRLGEREASQEIDAEVFMQLLEKIRSRSTPHNIPGWLFAKAGELVAQRLQSSWNSKPAFEEQVGGAETGLGKYGTFFRRSLQRISTEQQHYLALRFSQVASSDDLARWLEMPELEVRSLQFQALNALLAALGGKAVNGSGEGIERALQVCLNNLQPDSQLEELSAVYPKWSEELQSLLEVARFSQFPGGIDPLQREPLLAEIPGIGSAQELSRADFSQAAVQRVRSPWSPRLVKITLAVIGLAALACACLGGVAVLSARSLPGSLLYETKRSLEDVRLSITYDPTARLELELRYDQRRRDEVGEMLRLGRAGSVNFSGNLDQMEGDRWLVGGLPVIVPADTQIVGSLKPGYAVSVFGEITPQGAIQAQRLQLREYQVWDRLQDSSPNSLLIGDLQVGLTPETILHGSPQPGDRVVAYLLLPSNQFPEARLIEVIE
jgi:RNA polymerase sigma-70 factor, ECF subfamily